MTIVSTTFRCDRDGLTADGAGEELPANWARVSVSPTAFASAVSLVSGTLCPQCAADFAAFMAQPGGGAAQAEPQGGPA
jgi:hypothetical protein